MDEEETTFWSENWEKECNKKRYDEELTAEEREEEFVECLNKSSHWPLNQHERREIITPSPKSKVNVKDSNEKTTPKDGNMKSRYIDNAGGQIKKISSENIDEFPDMEAVRESRESAGGNDFHVADDKLKSFDFYDEDADDENSIHKPMKDYDFEDKLDFINDEMRRWEGDNPGSNLFMLPNSTELSSELNSFIVQGRQDNVPKPNSTTNAKSLSTAPTPKQPATSPDDKVSIITEEASTVPPYVPGNGTNATNLSTPPTSNRTATSPEDEVSIFTEEASTTTPYVPGKGKCINTDNRYPLYI